LSDPTLLQISNLKDLAFMRLTNNSERHSIWAYLWGQDLLPVLEDVRIEKEQILNVLK